MHTHDRTRAHAQVTFLCHGRIGSLSGVHCWWPQTLRVLHGKLNSHCIVMIMYVSCGVHSHLLGECKWNFELWTLNTSILMLKYHVELLIYECPMVILRCSKIFKLVSYLDRHWEHEVKWLLFESIVEKYLEENIEKLQWCHTSFLIGTILWREFS